MRSESRIFTSPTEEAYGHNFDSGRRGDEEKFIEQAKSGDAKACVKLVEKYSGFIDKILSTKSVRMDDRPDVIQQIVHSLYRNIRHFSGNGTEFSFWLKSIVERRCADYFRSEFGRKGQRSALSASKMESADTEEFLRSASHDSEFAEEIVFSRERLRRLVADMPEILTPMEMRLVQRIVNSKESLSSREYARELEVTESRISQIISSIIKKIERWDSKL